MPRLLKRTMVISNNANYEVLPTFESRIVGALIRPIEEYNEKKWRWIYRFLTIVKCFIWYNNFHEIEFINSIIIGLIAGAMTIEERNHKGEEETFWNFIWSSTNFYRRLVFICLRINMYYIESLVEVDKRTGGTVSNEMLLKMITPWIGAMLGSFCGQYVTILRDESVGGVAGGLLGLATAEFWIKQFPFVSRY
ncbi:hypothetical protein GCK72_008670 [Caenorhabditis remanei]|uniref:Uncharacterized protein n=1 Tax=Caenorhabditis remanei TaxID=31234 RepID=A0A6A5H093_CAERE|nr:hypothetical protein GCK72_008670 [Caenorhabditis remanei]KAF1760421.1 hypothetical protein GCK72_008670 [Caenorhabditis remanei]